MAPLLPVLVAAWVCVALSSASRNNPWDSGWRFHRGADTSSTPAMRSRVPGAMSSVLGATLFAAGSVSPGAGNCTDSDASCADWAKEGRCLYDPGAHIHTR